MRVKTSTARVASLIKARAHNLLIRRLLERSDANTEEIVGSRQEAGSGRRAEGADGRRQEQAEHAKQEQMADGRSWRQKQAEHAEHEQMADGRSWRQKQAEHAEQEQMADSRWQATEEDFPFLIFHFSFSISHLSLVSP